MEAKLSVDDEKVHHVGQGNFMSDLHVNSCKPSDAGWTTLPNITPPITNPCRDAQGSIVDGVDIHEVLATRKSTHGDITVQAGITQALKFTLRGSKNWGVLYSTERECLEMIANKIGRILAGDPHYEDHWRDIAGYATLVADRCKREL